jgi:protein-S-isoprenylcysteine O-methyltransferase Ste14
VRRAQAAVGSVVFFVVAPGVLAGFIPWLLTDWQGREPPLWVPLRIGGVLLIAAGGAVLVPAFVRFVVEGVGTPAPVAPTEHLVVGGLYRYVRNPMYMAVLTIILGQALLLGRAVLVPYAAAVAVAFIAFVHWYEEPTLRRRFGAGYEEYRRSVPGWWPRRNPWRPE